jgi:DNA-binding GntR family transcriptional regulator
MSRTPVRDALQRLQHEGMIRSLPRRGLIVAPLTPEQAEEVYELQEALEGMAARLAALRATPEQRRELVAIARRLGPAAGDPDEWVKVDTAYHELVMAAAQSRAVERASAALGAQLLRFRALAALNRPDRPARSAKEHLRIAHAIAKGNADVALRLTHAHWAAVRDEAVENLQIYARMTGVIGSDRRLALSPARAAGDPLPR